MSFVQKYPIIPRYLTAPSKRRSGRHTDPIKFIVAHDTGNPGSTASGNVSYYERSRDAESASAHLFVDDHEILECIPALTGTPEKAWHVLYNVDTDDRLFGANANDAAIGVEYCYGAAINSDEAYRRYIWTIAYACHQFGLDPSIRIVGHAYLDPARKTDPITGLAQSRRTYEQLLRDIVAEYNECIGKTSDLPIETALTGNARATVSLRLRSAPALRAQTISVVTPGTQLQFIARVEGDAVNGNAQWLKTPEGLFFWSGGVET